MPSPAVAIISNALTPYRLHFHRRLVREVPGIEWHSVFTHDVSNAPWSPEAEAEIRPVRFGINEKSDDQSRLSRSLHEFRKGGRIISWLVEKRIAAVVLLGYNDAGRLRILRWCHGNGVPCFLFGDSNIKGDRASGIKAWMKKRVLAAVLSRVAGVLACGSLGRAYFRRYGVADEKIHYMPYEPDYELIASITAEDSCDAFRSRGLPLDRDYVVYCGRLAMVKRVDLLLRAFASIAESRPSWDLLIVGDGPEKSALQQQVPESLRHRIHWAGFSSDQREVASLQRGTKVLVLPSDFEPWGVVINEALAATLAVIATDSVGAAAELVRDGINGRIVPCGDLQALANALQEVTNDLILGRYQSGSVEVLGHWRRVADPVKGLLTALQSVNVKPGD